MIAVKRLEAARRGEAQREHDGEGREPAQRSEVLAPTHPIPQHRPK
jgi:hypothetical protein